MTQAEFAKGWRLLILQPWGWSYRQMINGKPTVESQNQMEFYYSKLAFSHPDAWLKVADLYAQGNEWPSVSDLKSTLRQIQPQLMKLIAHAPQEGHEPMPEALRERIAKTANGKKFEP